MTGPAGGTGDRLAEVRRLHAERPRSRVLRLALTGFAVLLVASWFVGGFGFGELLTPRRLENLDRFLEEIRPPEARGEGGLLAWLGWGVDLLFSRRGLPSMLSTLAISILAILLAFFAALLLAPPGARSLARPNPWLPEAGVSGRGGRLGWRLVVAVTRSAYVALRSVPEYVWAYLLLSLLGLSAWPAILALAIHNSGILGKLYSETIENVPPAVPGALRGLGGTRRQVTVLALFPLLLPRLLVYFFYRWETCVREATVLGMLGILSLGSHIALARAADRQDDMFALILLGAALVLIGDVVSSIVRRHLRDA